MIKDIARTVIEEITENFFEDSLKDIFKSKKQFNYHKAIILNYYFTQDINPFWLLKAVRFVALSNRHKITYESIDKQVRSFKARGYATNNY